MTETTQKPRISLTAQEFIDAWSGGYKGVKKEDGKGYWSSSTNGDCVTFQSVIVNELVCINKSKDLPVLIISNSELQDFWVTDSDLGIKSSIFLYKSTIGNVNLSSAVLNFFKVYESTVKNILITKKSKINSVELEYSTTGFISIHSSIITKSFIITNDSIVKGDLNISQSKLRNVGIGSKELRKIRIHQVSYIQLLLWYQDTFCSLTIDNCQLETMAFNQGIIPKDSVFQINNTHVNAFKCNQLVNTGWLNISGLRPLVNYKRFDEDAEGNPKIENNEFVFKKVTNRNSILYFNSSDLGKTSFVNCDLTAFDNFVFLNTKMLEVFVAGTELPKQVSLPKENQNEKHAQQRLAFGQFKKIAENRGDNVQVTEFLALEMNAYAKQIAGDATKRGERFNLWLNKFSSNWGNDWVRAVWVTIGVNSCLFLLYCLSLGYQLGNDWGLFYKLASYSLEFLNPLRKADFLQTEITPLARVIDYASRIIVSYFTYQTIQAFRRFGKKS